MNEDNTQKPISEDNTIDQTTSEEVKVQSSDTEKMANDSKKEGKFSRRMMMKMGCCVLGLVIVGGGIFGGYWMVYRTSGTNALKTWMINYLPLPVAVVDGQTILLRDYNENVKSAEYFFDQQAQQGATTVQRPSEDELHQNELDRMVDLTLMEHVAKERNITISNQDVDDYFTTNILPQANNSLDDVNSTLKKLYGWSVDDFKKQVLYPVVLKQKLQTSFSDDGFVVVNRS